MLDKRPPTGLPEPSKPTEPGPPEKARARLKALGVPTALLAGKGARDVAVATLGWLRKNARGKR